jgi:serine phosphatase RsbU (regulator of sigma subunit)
LAELLETLGEAITIRDPHDKLVYANQAALRHLGFETLDELRARSLDSIMDDYIVTDERGGPLQMSDVPSVRLLRGQTADPLLMRTVDRRTGEVRWDLLKTAGLAGRDGKPSAAVTVIEDLTAVKTAEVHLRILSEAGRVLTSMLGLEQMLQSVAELAIPEFADWCAVDLIAEDLARDHVAIAHADPARRALVAQVSEFRAPRLSPDSMLGRVFLTGRSVLLEQVGDELLQQRARNQTDLELIRALGIRSGIVAPLRVRARTIGVMTFCTAESQRRLTREDLALAEQLADRVAIAVESSRLQTTISRVAETLQQSLRPNDPPAVPGWELAALYRPAGAPQRIDVGGDFYEVFDAGPASIALIGDVTGHSVTAATVTALMRHGARFASRLEPQPAAILHRLDEELRRMSSTTLCTALCARIGPRELVLSSAGHPPALRVDAGGSVTEAPAPGPLLGAFEDARWVEETIAVGPGEVVLLYTDGVTEAAGKDERFGLHRLRALLSSHAGSSPAVVLEALAAALDEFRASDDGDDVAALALRPSS